MTEIKSAKQYDLKNRNLNWGSINSKHEARSTKFETNSNDKNYKQN